MKSVESVEKFFLGGISSCDELDVVHEKVIHLAVFFSEFRGGLASDGGNEFVGEFFAFYVSDHGIGSSSFNFVHDGEEKMGFSKAGIAMDEKRVIISDIVGCNGHCCGVSEFVGRTYDKGVESIFIFARFHHFGFGNGRIIRNDSFRIMYVLENYNFDREAENVFETFCEKFAVFFGNNVLFEFGIYAEFNFFNGEFDRFNILYPKVIGNFGHLGLAKIFYKIENFIKRIHFVFPPFCINFFVFLYMRKRKI